MTKDAEPEPHGAEGGLPDAAEPPEQDDTPKDDAPARESDPPPPAEQAPRPAAQPRRRLLVSGLVGAAIVGAAGGLYWAATRPAEPAPVSASPAQRSAADAVPSGVMVLVTVDLEALRASPLAAPYLAGERSIEGLGKVREACGFDPVTAVRELALAVPQGGGSDLGLVATGAFGDQAVAECAAKVIASRGGNPIASSLGSFRTVRDLGAPGSGEIAVRPGGPLLLGEGAFLRTMVDTADGALPSVQRDAGHVALRKELAGHETVRVSLVLSKEQRAVVADEIRQTEGAPPALAAVQSAGAGVALAGDVAKVRLVVVCDDEAAAEAIAGLARDAKSNAGESTPAALLGAEKLLERVEIERRGAHVVASVEARVGELESIVERAVQVRSLLEAAQRRRRAPEPAPSAAPAPSK